MSNLKSQRQSTSLGSTLPKSCCYIELTLNLPRTSAFANATSMKQRLFYLKIYNLIKCTFGPLACTESEHYFEYCKTGHVHLHSLIKFELPGKHVPIGVVADIVKVYLSQLTKKYSNYADSCMYSDYIRYKSPSIVCQYTEVDNIERIEIWRNYIKKYS